MKRYAVQPLSGLIRQLEKRKARYPERLGFSVANAHMLSSHIGIIINGMRIHGRLLQDLRVFDQFTCIVSEKERTTSVHSMQQARSSSAFHPGSNIIRYIYCFQFVSIAHRDWGSV